MKKYSGIILTVAVLLICIAGGAVCVNEYGYMFLGQDEEECSKETVSETQIQDDIQKASQQEKESASIADTKREYIATAEEMGIRELLKVEAGTEKIDERDFFYAYQGQKATIDRTFDEDMLSKVGEVYSVVLTYEEQEYPCAVEIVDTTAPEFTSYKNITITEGDSIAYKKQVEVLDNSKEEVELSVDSSNVISTEPGQYQVLYKASDPYGNVSELTLQVTVKERPVCSEETVGPLADEVVASVITDDMSQWDKAYALFGWCRKNVRYTTTTGDRSSVWAGAYEGIGNRKGDCYSFAATYSVLLTRAGIENVIVSRVGGTSPHYWNLVYTEVGWYHCDTSPRSKKYPYICFMQTDAQIAAYTATYTEKPNYYTFDTTAYPERGTEIVFQ